MAIPQKFYNFDKEKYQQQVKKLEELITANSSYGKFYVVNMEAGSGKSRITEEIIARLDKKVLYVKPFIQSCNEAEEYINNLAGKKKAIAITTKNRKKINSEELVNYDIVIITHEWYKILCKNLEEKQNYIRGRHTLIIDEAINLPEIIVFDEKFLSEIKSEKVTPSYRMFRELDDLILRPIQEILGSKQQDSMKLFRFPRRSREKFKQIIWYFYKKSSNNLKLKQKLDELYELINNIGVIKKNTYGRFNTLLTYNSRIEYWGLKNNIILDATGHLNYLFQKNSEFKLVNMDNVFNYEHYNLHIYPVATTKIKVKRADNFYDTVVDIITRNKEKTLVVTCADSYYGRFQENFKKRLQEFKNVSVEHFGNLRGKNKWRDYTRCYITMIPNYQYESYVVHYLYFKRIELGHDTTGKLNIKTQVSEGVMRFENAELEKIRINTCVAEIYQAIKRINRDNKEKAEINLFCHDSQIVKELIKQFPNIKRETQNLEVNYSKHRKYQYDLLIEVLQDLPPGEYNISLLRSMLQRKLGRKKEINKGQFTRLFYHSKVKNYMEENNICKIDRKIIKNSK